DPTSRGTRRLTSSAMCSASITTETLPRSCAGGLRPAGRTPSRPTRPGSSHSPPPKSDACSLSGRGRLQPMTGSDAAPARRPRVVIVGGGFGGTHAAHALRHAPVDVLILDRTNHSLFHPLLYQVATAGLSADEIAIPIRTIFESQKNVEVQ